MTPGTDTVGLTEDDYDQLADMVENGVHRYKYDGTDPAAELRLRNVTCRHCGYRWDYSGRRTWAECPACRKRTPLYADTPRRPQYDIDQRKCNAIREAARDGRSYTAIARLFNFVDSPTTVSDHAQGRCDHDGVPPVHRTGDGGEWSRKIDPVECRRLREAFDNGTYTTFTEAADGESYSRHTVSKHVNGDCACDS